MTRLLGLLLLIGLGWLVVRALLGSGQRLGNARREPDRFEKTVRCERCDRHMPPTLAKATATGHVCDDGLCGDTRREASARAPSEGSER